MNMKMMLLIIVIVLIIVGGGVAAILILGNNNSSAPPEPTPEPEVVVMYSPGDFFVTNLAAGEDQTNHLVRLAVTLQLDSDAYYNALMGTGSGHGEEATGTTVNYQPVIREAILFVLRNTTPEELLADDSNGQPILRGRIIDAVNQAMRGLIILEHERKDGGDHFIGVIISDLVVQ